MMKVKGAMDMEKRSTDQARSWHFTVGESDYRVILFNGDVKALVYRRPVGADESAAWAQLASEPTRGESGDATAQRVRDRIEGTNMIDLTPGTRVEVPAYTDEWMRGDRYGEVRGGLVYRESGNLISVKLDRSGRRVRFVAHDVRVVR